jgi:hypothetical protein
MVMDLMDYYDYDEREVKRMLHSSGPERIYMADQVDCGGSVDEVGANDERKEEDADI